MDVDVNQVTITGTLERDPITRFQPDGHGSQHVCFTLRCCEMGPAGQTWQLYVPVECYGNVAELLGELSAGDSILVAGKLKWTSWQGKDGQKRTSLAVLARQVKRLAAAEVTA
jgi:single-strand DNA-binding protein